MAPHTRKAELRRHLAAADRAHSAEERAQASRAMGELMRRQEVWRTARSVLCFWPMALEPDLRPLIVEACGAGKIVGLPRFDVATGIYGVCEVTDPEQQMAPGYYGIMEPLADCAARDPGSFELYLVPGMGFSLQGARLGRGKGYYDRMLTGSAGFKCGVAFDWQVTPEIPLESHDISMDAVLTQSGYKLMRISH